MRGRGHDHRVHIVAHNDRFPPFGRLTPHPLGQTPGWSQVGGAHHGQFYAGELLEHRTADAGQ
jgi:hypothetical protein